MDCPKCGYVLEPFDATCPRCARMAHTRCAVCGRDGVVATCEKCRHEVCAECATTPGPDTVCNACRAQEQAPAEARDAPLEVIASAQGGYGFFDSIARAFTFLKESVLMAMRDKDLILPSIFSTAVSIVVIGMMLLLLWSTGLLRQMGGRDDQAAQPLWLIVVSAVIFLVSHVIGYFFVGMTINLVDTHLHGRDAKLGEAFADARRNFAALIFLAVASSAVSLAMSLIRKRGGGLGDLAAGGVGRSWTVLTYLILPAIILEDISLRAAINRARDIHSRNLLGIAVGEVGVIALTNVLGVVGVICAGLAGFAVFTVGAGAIIPAVIVGGLVVSLVTAFTMYVRGAYYTCLYLWAVATERQGERVAAPAPLAASLSYGR